MFFVFRFFLFFFFNDTATTEIYTLSLHDALPIWPELAGLGHVDPLPPERLHHPVRSEEHTSELQSLAYLVCRLLLEKKKTTFPLGTTTMTCKTIDAAGNPSTCSFTVTVIVADLSLTMSASPSPFFF